MSTDTQSFNFLLVDDDVDDSDLFKEMASEIDPKANINMLSGGGSLMEYLAHADGAMPDLILLDINMPGKDGLELLDILKADKNFRRIPVVMYTTSTNPANIEKARKLGAYAYITKPNNISEMRKILTEILTADWKTKRMHNNFVIGG